MDNFGRENLLLLFVEPKRTEGNRLLMRGATSSSVQPFGQKHGFLDMQIDQCLHIGRVR